MKSLKMKPGDLVHIEIAGDVWNVHGTFGTKCDTTIVLKTLHGSFIEIPHDAISNFEVIAPKFVLPSNLHAVVRDSDGSTYLRVNHTASTNDTWVGSDGYFLCDEDLVENTVGLEVIFEGVKS
jgi:hypothetical protein